MEGGEWRSCNYITILGGMREKFADGEYEGHAPIMYIYVIFFYASICGCMHPGSFSLAFHCCCGSASAIIYYYLEEVCKMHFYIYNSG